MLRIINAIYALLFADPAQAQRHVFLVFLIIIYKMENVLQNAQEYTMLTQHL
jgi:hypothetical protein